MKIYTKTGDKGTTSLVYGQRISKNDIRVEAYGTIDEANSIIGMVISQLKETLPMKARTELHLLTEEEEKQVKQIKDLIPIMQDLQTTLFHVGAELSTPKDKEVKWKLKERDILGLEEQIDQWNASLPELKRFILPGGSIASSTTHMARTVIRRAERIVVSLEEVNPLVLAYLNRLSDYLFVAARYMNQIYDKKEPVLHEKEAN